MNFVFLSAYKVLGISKPPKVSDIVLFEETDPSTKVLITRDLDAHWYVLDRHLAITSMFFRGMAFDQQKGELEEQLEKEISTIRENRAKTVGRDAILFIKIRGNIETNSRAPKQEFGGIELYYDAYDKNGLRSSLQNRLSGILTAVRIGGNNEYQFEKVGEGSYLIASDGKLIHSISVEGFAPTINTSRPISDDQTVTIGSFIQQIPKEENLDRVVRLFAYSLDRNTDILRSFISAWSALEILINKIFKVYRDCWEIEFEKISIVPNLEEYRTVINEAMEKSLSLTYKFAVISICLDEKHDANDIATFKKIKKVRDHFFHGQDIEEATLPISEAQCLFDKYFGNHILRINNSPYSP